MTKQEIEEMTNAVKNFNKDFIALTINDYLHQEKIGMFFTQDLIEIIDDAITRTENAIDADYFYFIPSTVDGQNYVNIIVAFLFELENHQIMNLNSYLKLILSYQAQNGIWHLSDSQSNQKKLNEIKTIESSNKSIRRELKDLRTMMESQIADFEINLKKIKEYELTRKRDTDEIDNLVNVARKQSEEISLKAKDIDSIYKDYSVLLARDEEKSTALFKDMNIRKDAFDVLIDSTNTQNNSSEKLLIEIESKNAEFERLLNSVVNKSSDFELRLVQLNELLGKEAAQQLFNTFNARKNELKKPVKNWAMAVYGVTFIAFTLIMALFTNGFGRYGPVIPASVDWQYVLITLTKTFPILLIFYFTIRQYNRERTFMEEYAFRSAIALTIQAYAELAGERKGELIMNAVTNIYASPKSMRESNSLFNLNSKYVPETLKEIKETLNTLVTSKKD